VTLPFVLILIAAAVYAAGALLVKRAADLGVGVWRTAFVSNLTTAVLFQPLWLLGGTIHLHLWWQPALVALCFVAGQWLTYISLEQGDVSVATPVLGIKILLVAVFVTLWVGEALRWQLWVAAVLATIGIGLLNRSGARAPHRRVGRTIVTAGLAAISFTVLDVLVQEWSPGWGLGRFLPVTLMISSVFSLAFVRRFRAPLSAISPPTWRWLLGGTLLIGGQAVVFVSVIAKWGQVAPVNVVYSSRGLWSVVLVWLFGHWVKSREQQLGPGVLAWRLAGAVFMMLAIALVLV
jgi:drug/metabolite transporter (DMT)-like permease